MSELPSHREVEIVNGIMGTVIHPDFQDPDHLECGISCEDLEPDAFTEVIRRVNRSRLISTMSRYGSIEATVFGEHDVAASGREGLYFNEVPGEYSNTILHGDGSDLLLINSGIRASSTILAGRRTGLNLLNNSVGRYLSSRNIDDLRFEDARQLLAQLNTVDPLYPENSNKDLLAEYAKDLGEKLGRIISPEDFLRLNRPVEDAIRSKRVHQISWDTKPGRHKAAFISKDWLHARYSPTLEALEETNPAEWVDLRHN